MTKLYKYSFVNSMTIKGERFVVRICIDTYTCKGKLVRILFITILFVNEKQSKNKSGENINQ